MTKIILLLLTFFTCANLTYANENCFIVKENEKTLISEGNCQVAYSPESTFKIALSLIGFDDRILKNKLNPLWSLPEGVDPYINICRSKHDPRTWMRDSCLWYSRILTNELGMEKLQSYISKFSYGNMDLSNGINDFWISSSLKISPIEQADFLQKMIDHKLPVSAVSYEYTKNIIFLQNMAGGWKLYGRTGNGRKLNINGNKTELQHGWFIGYIEKDGRKIVFANHLVDNKKENVFASLRAKNDALNRIWYLINELEKPKVD